jgi:putative aldouronate transport system permease protein
MNIAKGSADKATVYVKKKKGFKFYLMRDWQLYLLLLPPLIAVAVFKYAPLFGLTIAFKDYNIIKGFAKSPWVGFAVFEKIFQMKDFYIALKNTLVLNILNLVIGFPTPIILAILLNEIKNAAFKKTSQTLLYLPHFLSWVIISGIFYQLLSPTTGLVNVFVTRAGGTAIPFLTEKWHWLVSYVLIGVWQAMGWGTIIFLAAIAGVSAELYEAATVDGAGRWDKIIHVTLPSIKGTIVTMLILNLGKIMGSSFEQANSLGNAMVRDFSEVIATFVYAKGLQSGNYSVATAVGLFQSVVGLILVLSADKVAKKMGESGLI